MRETCEGAGAREKFQNVRLILIIFLVHNITILSSPTRIFRWMKQKIRNVILTK
jgi:hypothetical protein